MYIFVILMNQIHSNKVIFVEKPNSQTLNADGIISNRKDLILGVLTADCAPIVILGKKYFGIIHAGWKGAIGGIIENTIDKIIKMQKSQNYFQHLVEGIEMDIAAFDYSSAPFDTLADTLVEKADSNENSAIFNFINSYFWIRPRFDLFISTIGTPVVDNNNFF